MVASWVELLYGSFHGAETMMANDKARRATVIGLSHDLRSKRSFVVLEWDDNVEKRLSLRVPFGCGPEELPNEAQRAVRELSAETTDLIIYCAD